MRCSLIVTGKNISQCNQRSFEPCVSYTYVRFGFSKFCMAIVFPFSIALVISQTQTIDITFLLWHISWWNWHSLSIFRRTIWKWLKLKSKKSNKKINLNILKQYILRLSNMQPTIFLSVCFIAFYLLSWLCMPLSERSSCSFCYACSWRNINWLK